MGPSNRLHRRLDSYSLPNSWTPDQALAIADFCDRLCSSIWDAHSEEMLDRLDDIAKRSLNDDRLRQLSLPIDDDIPF